MDSPYTDLLKSINEEIFQNLKTLSITYFEEHLDLYIFTGFKHLESLSFESSRGYNIPADSILKLVRNNKPGIKISG